MDVVLKSSSKSIFKNQNFMLLLIGQVVSNLGNAIHSTAVIWYIMSMVAEDRSGAILSILGLCSLIPSIVFGPISGVYVDKLDRKKIIVGTDIIRGSLALLLATFTFLNIIPLPALFIVTALSTFFGTLFNPAVDSSIPNVVEDEMLTKANSLNGISRQLVWILGAAISGILYAYVGIVGIFIINGLSFILSGLSEMFIKLPERKKKEENDTIKESTFLKDFKDGIVYMKGQKVIMVLMSFALVLNFLYNPIFSIIFPKTIKFTLGVGAKHFGWFNSIFAIGSIAGMIILNVLPKREKVHNHVLGGITIQSILFLMFSIPIIPRVLEVIGGQKAFIIYCVIAFLMMICNVFVNVPLFTVFQRIVPDEYRGRFFGMLNTLTQGIVPLGLIFIGVVSDLIPVYIIYIVAGSISLALSIWMFFIKEFKEL